MEGKGRKKKEEKSEEEKKGFRFAKEINKNTLEIFSSSFFFCKEICIKISPMYHSGLSTVLHVSAA